MDRLIHTPGEQPKERLEVRESHKGDEASGYSQGYTKGTNITDHYERESIQQFVKDTKHISSELTTLEETILPKLAIDEATRKRIDEYEKKQAEQKLFPPLQIKGDPPIFWKAMACENRIKYGEKRINNLAKYNKSYKDLEGHPENLLNHYRYLQKRHYECFEEDCKVLKNAFLYLYKEHATDLKYNFESIIANQNNSEGESAKKLEKQYENLKERYSILKGLSKDYNALKNLEQDDNTKVIKHEILKDLEECYQHRYQDYYASLEGHLKHLKEIKKNLDTKRYTHLEKLLKDLEKLSSYLIENCKGLNIQYRKYIEKHMKVLKEKWEGLEKHEDKLEERCKKLEEHWEDFVESSKKAYLPDIKLMHEKMISQEKELSNILDVYNKKRKGLMKIKHSLEGKQKELHTSRDRSQEPEKSSYQDDSHSVPTGLENLSLDNLHRNIDKLEKRFDDKIALIHRDLKKLSFHLEGNLFYFLKRQRHKTDFYLKNSSLLHLPEGQECGIACTIMVTDLSQCKEKVEKLLQSFTEVDSKQLRKDKEGLTPTYTYPLVLKSIGHYINYEYAKVSDIAMNKYETPDKNVKYDNAYRSKMGKDPKEITIDEFRNAIGQKDKDGNVIPVIASITMDFHTKCHHAIVLDGWDKTPEGEELLVIRDIHTELSPDTGKPLTNDQGRSWKDFMEVWTGVAVIPVFESDQKM